MSSTKDFIDEVKGCLGGRSSNAENITYENANFPQCKDVDAALDILACHFSVNSSTAEGTISASISCKPLAPTT